MDDERAPGTTDVSAAIARVDQVDLAKIGKKLQYDDPGYWTEELLVKAEAAYRRFLVLNLLYPGQQLAVNKVLDEFWHNHILDTAKYAQDCEDVFGSFLHHYPYFGLPGEDDEGQNLPAFAVTETIWQDVFGSTLGADTKIEAEPRLTLERVLGGLVRVDDGPDAGPKGCKNGQHCNKVIAPPEIEASDPIVAVLEEF
jgi:hypothetical protein